MTGFGSPCGICFYEGHAFGAKNHNSAFHCDAGPREARRYTHTISGAGREGHSDLVLTADDPYFRPVDVCVTPDGCLAIADWYDGGVGGHDYDNPDQGRIFLLRPRAQQPKRREKPGPYATIPDALEGLESPNLATQFWARQKLLAEGGLSVAPLQQLLSDDDPNVRARALWVLDRIGGDGSSLVVAQLQSQDPQFRALAVRILGGHGGQYTRDILSLANDPSDEVLREVLIALRGVRGQAITSAIATAASRYTGDDRYLLEAINIASANRKPEIYDCLTAKQDLAIGQINLMFLLNPDAALTRLKSELARHDSTHSATRDLLSFAATVQSREGGRTLLDYVDEQNASPELRAYALEILSSNLQDAWSTLAEDAELESVFRGLLQDEVLAQPTLKAIGNRNLVHLSGDVLALVKSTSASDETRCQAIACIAELRPDQCAAALRGELVSPRPAVRKAALTALVDLNDVETLRELFTNAGEAIDADYRSAMVERALASTGGALVLRGFLADQLLHDEFRQLVVSAAVHHPDAYVRSLYEEFVPASERPQRLQDSVSAEQILALTGDALRGKQVFLRSSASQCKKCHRVRGVGDELGPDLSMIGKKYGREALLETILQPSKAIADEYRIHVAQTTDGRMLAGIVAEKNDQKLVLKDAQDQLHTISLEEIESLTTSPQSVMPELILGDISLQEAADLLEYLTTLK